MTNTSLLQCDGCGQPASPEHITRRLQRLEWTTRYRPVHIGTLLLGAAAPASDAEFLYADSGEFAGEARALLTAASVSPAGKSAEATLSEFQRGGFLLTHVLECPLDPGARDAAATEALLSARLSALVARIRRSLRPKRLVPISGSLASLLNSLETIDLGCPILLDNGKPFALNDDGRDQVIDRLRQALAVVGVPAR
jgi:hypothetical protein